MGQFVRRTRIFSYAIGVFSEWQRLTEDRFNQVEINKTKIEVDVMNAFKRAKMITKAILKKIVSDKMGSYPMAIERAFIHEKKPYHKVAISGATTPHANQWAERLNNTVKERNKVQRGWKKDSTPLRNGQTIYYNYIRPHMTLDGKTPAEVAGLGKETWRSLIRKAVLSKVHSDG